MSISAAWSHRSCSGSTMIIGSNRQSKSHHDAPKYPIASRITNLHSHSMVLDHGNALIFQRKFFLPTVKARPSVRQISSLLISKGKSRDSNFARLRQLSPTIGRFFVSSVAQRILRQREKTVNAYSTRRSRSPCLVSPDHTMRPIEV